MGDCRVAGHGRAKIHVFGSVNETMPDWIGADDGGENDDLMALTRHSSYAAADDDDDCGVIFLVNLTRHSFVEKPTIAETQAVKPRL